MGYSYAGSRGPLVEAGQSVFEQVADLKALTFNPMDWGAKGDGVHDDTTAIQLAINACVAAGAGMVYLPPGNYVTGQPLTFKGNNIAFVCAPGVIINYANNFGAALTISGQNLRVVLHAINAPSAPYNLSYHDLLFSKIDFLRPGACTTACIFHDGTLQTAPEGGNIWYVGTVSAGSCQYGIKIDSSNAAHTYEGDIWSVLTIFSATTCSIQVGTAGVNLVRWNTFAVGIGGQGITPLYVNANNDANFYTILNADQATGAQEAIFAAGTKDNWLIAPPTTVGAFRVTDNGTNVSIVPGATGTGRVVLSKQLQLPGLPTSSAGLPSGSLWNNAGVVNIV